MQSNVSHFLFKIKNLGSEWPEQVLFTLVLIFVEEIKNKCDYIYEEFKYKSWSMVKKTGANYIIFFLF